MFQQKDNLWREFLNPLRGLTMERIVQIIEQGERGAYADLQWFYQAMERSDALIATVVMRRRAALLASRWEAAPERTPTDPVLAREQAAFLCDEYDKVANLRECVAYLSTATFRGYAHAEKHYDGQGGVVRLEPVEQWFWCRQGMFGGWEYNREARSGVSEGEKVLAVISVSTTAGARYGMDAGHTPRATRSAPPVDLPRHRRFSGPDFSVSRGGAVCPTDEPLRTR